MGVVHTSSLGIVVVCVDHIVGKEGLLGQSLVRSLGLVDVPVLNGVVGWSCCCCILLVVVVERGTTERSTFVAGSDAVSHEAEVGYLVVVVGRGVNDHVGIARLLSRWLNNVEAAHIDVVMLLLLGQRRRWRKLATTVMLIG